MQIRTLFFVIILGAIGALAALNWEAFNTPAALWLGVATIQAPLGVVMLGLTGALTFYFLVCILYLQSSVMLEARRHAKELQNSRELEASRFSELHRFIEEEIQSVAKQDAEAQSALLQRLDKLDTGVVSAVEQSGNTLAAYIGELEDRLERGGTTIAPNRPV
ncbi:Signal transduction histidine kinase [Herminiimonas sp. KBW02]|uniref:LapA family protein n=1 Tax=Herminiimonas sp. KBW02 TaxID=2153363 RepID=UPI000F5A27A2|nr:LapA family protein [Herminiimonas sp. KBW02]RQO35907.1 Signal transduction histidine kinase [Herminiimonas sp. KBW02]